MKIRTRILIAFLVIIGLGFYFLIDWIRDDVKPRYRESAEEILVDTSRVLAALAAAHIEEGELRLDSFREGFQNTSNQVFSARIYDLQKTRVDLRVYVTDTQGIVVFDSDGGRDEGKDYSQWNDVHLTLQGQYGARTTLADPDNPASSILHIGAPILDEGRIAGVLSVAKPTYTANLFIAAAKKKTIVAGLAVFAAVTLFGIFLSLWITHPLQALTTYARAVRDGKRIKAPDLGESEMGELRTAFEEMRDALEGKKYVEQYVETLTHEIKSPVSAIQGAAELLDESMPKKRRVRFTKTIRRENQRIQKIIDRLLELSSLEGKHKLNEEREINLASVVQEVMTAIEAAVSKKKISLAFKSQDHAPVFGEKFLIYHSVMNILQNAIAFTPPGGSIVVTLSRDQDSNIITVIDSGPGLPDYALKRAFERFYSLPRPDTGSKSSGLGLSFVREAVALHGGEVSLNNQHKGGAQAKIRLPLRSAEETV